MSLKRNRTGEKVLHVVTVDHSPYAFERIEDATALMKLMDRAKTTDYSSRALLLEQYTKRPDVRYSHQNVKATAETTS